jgi:hypothetical protein
MVSTADALIKQIEECSAAKVGAVNTALSHKC